MHAPLIPNPSSKPCRAPAPAPAHRLDKRLGEALPPEFRGGASGIAFGSIRIHHDSEAHQLANAAGADAFTFGRDIAFRAGQYRPATAAGRALLAHELAHLPESLRDGAHVYRAPRYETDRWPTTNTPPPPRNTTVALMRQQLTSQRTTGATPEITSFTVVGVTTPEQEIFLLNLIWFMGQRARWDTYVQLDAQIGWEQPVGTPTRTPQPDGRVASVSAGIIPTGVVRLTIDAQGAVRAELVRAIVQPAAASVLDLARADVVSRLQGEFGVLRIEDGTAAWSDHELRDVLGAMTLLPAPDRDALRGGVLRREAAIQPGLAGEFDSGSGGVTGTTISVAVPTLRLANAAFDHTRQSLGPADAVLPMSFMTILHELGHAVASQARRRAITAEHRAMQTYNVAVGRENTAADRWRETYQRYQGATGDARRQLATDTRQRQAEYEALRATRQAERGRMDRATAARAATEAPASQQAAFAASARTAGVDFRSAMVAANAALGAYAAPQREECAALEGALAAMATAVRDYGAASSHARDIVQEDAIIAAQGRRDAALTALRTGHPTHVALTDLAPAIAALDRWWEALRVARNADHRPARVQRFVDFVTTNGIVPLTTYARRSWPHRPEEFFAETYALWRSDPDFLRAQYPLLFGYFNDGTFR
ncbi:MAG: DUF4157 domain-containing protein [Polyangiales bacterium]